MRVVDVTYSDSVRVVNNSSVFKGEPVDGSRFTRNYMKGDSSVLQEQKAARQGRSGDIVDGEGNNTSNSLLSIYSEVYDTYGIDLTLAEVVVPNDVMAAYVVKDANNGDYNSPSYNAPCKLFVIYNLDKEEPSFSVYDIPYIGEDGEEAEPGTYNTHQIAEVYSFRDGVIISFYGYRVIGGYGESGREYWFIDNEGVATYHEYIGSFSRMWGAGGYFSSYESNLSVMPYGIVIAECEQGINYNAPKVTITKITKKGMMFRESIDMYDLLVADPNFVSLVSSTANYVRGAYWWMGNIILSAPVLRASPVPDAEATVTIALGSDEIDQLLHGGVQYSTDSMYHGDLGRNQYSIGSYSPYLDNNRGSMTVGKDGIVFKAPIFKGGERSSTEARHTWYDIIVDALPTGLTAVTTYYPIVHRAKEGLIVEHVVRDNDRNNKFLTFFIHKDELSWNSPQTPRAVLYDCDKANTFARSYVNVSNSVTAFSYARSSSKIKANLYGNSHIDLLAWGDSVAMTPARYNVINNVSSLYTIDLSGGRVVLDLPYKNNRISNSFYVSKNTSAIVRTTPTRSYEYGITDLCSMDVVVKYNTTRVNASAGNVNKKLPLYISSPIDIHDTTSNHILDYHYIVDYDPYATPVVSLFHIREDVFCCIAEDNTRFREDSRVSVFVWRDGWEAVVYKREYTPSGYESYDPRASLYNYSSAIIRIGLDAAILFDISGELVQIPIEEGSTPLIAVKDRSVFINATMTQLTVVNAVNGDTIDTLDLIDDHTSEQSRYRVNVVVEGNVLEPNRLYIVIVSRDYSGDAFTDKWYKVIEVSLNG